MSIDVDPGRARPITGMRFICLCYYDHARFEACTPARMEEVRRLCAPRDEALYATGRVLLVSSLGEPSAARTLRPTPSGGEVTVTDGPYAAGPEPLGAMFLIEAADLDEAIGIAKLHPGAALGDYFGGGIEVRPLDHLVMAPGRPAA
jgi:hypothetical protein